MQSSALVTSCGASKHLSSLLPESQIVSVAQRLLENPAMCQIILVLFFCHSRTQLLQRLWQGFKALSFLQYIGYITCYIFVTLPLWTIFSFLISLLFKHPQQPQPKIPGGLGVCLNFNEVFRRNEVGAVNVLNLGFSI